jgi:hypothetical protein
MSSGIQEIRRICAAQQRRNAVTINAIGWMAMAGGGVLLIDVFRPLGDTPWAVASGIVIGAGLSMLVADIVFRRLDRAHPVLEPGLSYTEYEFIQAETDERDAGEGERRADEAPSKGRTARAQGLSPSPVEIETAARSRAGETRHPEQHQSEAGENAGSVSGRDAGDGDGDAGRAGERIPGLERLSRSDPGHSAPPRSGDHAAIQPSRARQVER